MELAGMRQALLGEGAQFLPAQQSAQINKGDATMSHATQCRGLAARLRFYRHHDASRAVLQATLVNNLDLILAGLDDAAGQGNRERAILSLAEPEDTDS